MMKERVNMLNQLVIVGRLTENPVLEKNDEKNSFKINLAVPRNYKNINGEYDVDYIPCILWNIVGETTAIMCHKGDVLGIKGHIESIEDKITVIAEKVTFLTSKRENE